MSAYLLHVQCLKEVILITCSWSPSLAQKLISEALKELSRRAGQRNERVIVKIMYDKAGAANVMNPRQNVQPKAFAGEKIQLPLPTEVPHLDLEVCNLHVPLLGTLHAKFMVVDRKVAVIESNNTEDNDNVEMMTHFEGPIVDSIYDTALITWGLHLNPPLPSANTSATVGGLHADRQQEPLHMDRGQAREQHEIVRDGEAAQLPEHMPDDPHYDDDLPGEITRMQSAYSPKPNESRLQATNRQLNLACKKKADPSGPEISDEEAFTPYIPASTPAPFPIAVVSRLPYGTPNNHNVFVPQNEAWLSCIRNAKRDVFIQTPDLNATPLTQAIVAALKRGVAVTYYVCLGYNDAGELMPGQGGTNEMFATKLVESLSPFQRDLLTICYYVGKDQAHPIHNSFKQRSCHVKLLIADGHIGIQGSGNQDTQSWYHSQEINVMIDSEEVCRKWREGIERNQNTAKFGKADMRDGVWRDANGNKAEGSTEEPSSKAAGWVTGVKGMVKKMQDKGGF
ncbi:hypothetical protein ANO11243_049350 [Dothideomycetidae sp. 11243]|nr:hypothetical protein ANO11243_049350 [fungal sp. No.11243]